MGIRRKINIKKRGITFEQASYVFADPFALRADTMMNTRKTEDRWILMGKSLNESVLVVVHTFRNDDGAEIVRIISARKSDKKRETGIS